MYMYYPYFRGKQYELITIREMAPLLSKKSFVPIVEPVKKNLKNVQNALDSIISSDGKTILILNPQHGDFKKNNSIILGSIDSFYLGCPNILWGILLNENTTLTEILDLIKKVSGREIALIHNGFSDGKSLAQVTRQYGNINTSVFVDKACGKLYQKHFQKHKVRVLIRDGFQTRRNRDHPDAPEFFSDLHATFEMEGMTGFGDFLIVGDEYSETGGPAYTIAIHITYIDSEKDEAMYIKHFKSDRQDTPKDPAGKFAEALGKLIADVDSGNSMIPKTEALEEYHALHDKGHYPGLGYVKKLSMKHHIEVFSLYF